MDKGKRPPRSTTEERFGAKVDKTDGCWLWTGGVGTTGYGNFWHDGHTVLAHRWAYEDAYGPISPRLTIDHLCRNQLCVNSAHLEAVTQAVNVHRGALGVLKTHCLHGHRLPTKRDSRGRRPCLSCRHLLGEKRGRTKQPRPKTTAVGHPLASPPRWRVRVHRKVWYDAYGPIPKGYVIHHKDGDVTNNDLANLELLSRKGHGIKHSE